MERGTSVGRLREPVANNWTLRSWPVSRWQGDRRRVMMDNDQDEFRRNAMAQSGADQEPSEPAAQTSTERAKELLAQALERKKSAGQARSSHLDGHSGVGGATANHKATRTFRRKSG